MRARTWIAVGLVALATATAAAEPKPKPVDVKPFKDQLVVLSDSDGGTYVVLPGTGARVWYAAPKAKNLYEQIVIGKGASANEGSWDIAVWAPRIPNIQPGSVTRRADGTFARWCGSDNTIPLTAVSADKARAVVDKTPFLTTAMIRRPHLLARDDSGIYYYVDVIRDQYGGNGYRVFIGKKGAMKQRPLTDVATDTGGDVFATKTGDLRIVKDVDQGASKITWVKGEKRVTLSSLDVDANSALIYKDLGIYTFIGNICDSL
jgi:hypothetical protein